MMSLATLVQVVTSDHQSERAILAGKDRQKNTYQSEHGRSTGGSTMTSGCRTLFGIFRQTSLESSCTCSTTICTPILNATRQNKGALSPMPGSASSSESTSAFFTPNLSVLSSAFAGGISTLSASLAETYCTPLSRNSGSSTLFPPLMGFLEPL